MDKYKNVRTSRSIWTTCKVHASNSRLYPSIRNFHSIVFISSKLKNNVCPIICVKFDTNFFHGIEYRRIPRCSIPWNYVWKKLTQFIAQTLFFHFDEMKTILWKFRTDGYSLEFYAWAFCLPDRQKLFVISSPGQGLHSHSINKMSSAFHSFSRIWIGLHKNEDEHLLFIRLLIIV